MGIWSAPIALLEMSRKRGLNQGNVLSPMLFNLRFKGGHLKNGEKLNRGWSQSDDVR